MTRISGYQAMHPYFFFAGNSEYHWHAVPIGSLVDASKYFRSSLEPKQHHFQNKLVASCSQVLFVSTEDRQLIAHFCVTIFSWIHDGVISECIPRHNPVGPGSPRNLASCFTIFQSQRNVAFKLLLFSHGVLSRVAKSCAFPSVQVASTSA